MKRVILGSLLSCMLVGQLYAGDLVEFGSGAVKNTARFVGGAALGVLASAGIGGCLRQLAPAGWRPLLCPAENNECVLFASNQTGEMHLFKSNTPGVLIFNRLGSVNELYRQNSFWAVGSAASFVGALLAMYFSKDRSSKVCAAGGLLGSACLFYYETVSRRVLFDLHNECAYSFE